MNNEIWKDIPGYEGYYRVSNLGRVKSLARVVMRSNGKPYKVVERILKPEIERGGYLRVNLHLEGNSEPYKVHQLVAMAFFGHRPCGHKVVIDHINHNTKDNNVNNLRLVSNRQNCNHRKTYGSSRYSGVFWNKKASKWYAQIRTNGKCKHLGSFNSEQEASTYYEMAVQSIERGKKIRDNTRKPSSKHRGVYWHKHKSRWCAQIYNEGKKIHLGCFASELEAAKAYQHELNKIHTNGSR